MKRIVVKIGTKVLSKEDKTLDTEFLSHLVEQVVALRVKGIQVVLVTSGAVGAGRSILPTHEAVSETVQKQVFAAVGQVKLMSVYAGLFAKHGYHCAQVLVTKEDFRDETHYANMQNCFEGLLLDNVVPIVNENDVVATTELMFTDNDELAGLVAEQLKADTLLILTSTNGVLDNEGNTIPEVTGSNSAQVERFVNSNISTGGRGGMLSKFTTARALARKGIVVCIVDGKEERVLLEVSEGMRNGTRFA
jgi:glutamate 5-kinase